MRLSAHEGVTFHENLTVRGAARAAAFSRSDICGKPIAVRTGGVRRGTHSFNTCDLVATFYDSTGSRMGARGTREAGGTSRWTRREILFKVPGNAATLDAGIFLSITLFIQYNACREMPGEPFYTFTEAVLAAVDSIDIDRLVIDLRYNRGGDFSVMAPFIEALAERKELDCFGAAYVLIGRETFSSAVLNAIEIRRKLRATLVGEQTGGKPNHYGCGNGARVAGGGNV